jgi:ribose-phosphate pyrophosphokinase
VGRAGLAGRYAELLNLPLVVMHKRRTDFSHTETTHVVGDIKGRRPIIIDDLLAGGSVLKQIDALYQQGAQGQACFSITHPVLLPSALKILDTDDRIGKLIVTNTIPLTPEKRHPKIEVVSVGTLLADIIYDIHEGHSISNRLVKA